MRVQLLWSGLSAGVRGRADERDGCARCQGRRAPRTPWGDPDIQGTYTNTYENGTPLERPDQFAGRKLEDVKGEELARIATSDPEADGRQLPGPDPRARQLVAGQPRSRTAAARRGSSSIRPTARFRR